MKEKKRVLENHLEVFLTAFSLLFIEILFFKTALYILDYLQALMVVAYALCGLAAGAVAAHRMATLSNRRLFGIKLLLVFSLFLCFLNFVFFSSSLFLSPVLILPFAAGNILISYYMKENNAHGVYFADLGGAATGVLCATFFLPVLREENCFLLVGIVILFSIRPLQAGTKTIRVTMGVAAILGLALLGLNLHLDWINFARITIPSKPSPREKIFHHHDLDLLYSKGSNIQRIEVLSPYAFQAWEDEAPPILYVAFNGLVNDVVRPENHDRLTYRYDPRVVYGLIEKPDFLVIGTSAEGVVKTGAAHGGKVTGLEINPQIVALMKGPLLSYSKNAYDLLESLHTLDARTYLNTHPKPFDIITLMNSHMARQSGLMGPPEFLHTREAIHAYWTHLTDQGFMVFEEKYYRDSGMMSSIKILATILDVLKAQGVQNPGNNVFVYHWILNGLSILGDPGQSTVSHVMIVVKKRPFSPTHWEAVQDWANRVRFYYRSTHELVEIFPVDEKPSEFTRRVRDILMESPGSSTLRDTNDFSVITDDKPFPWSVDKNHTLIKSYLLKIGLVCLGILLGLAVYGVRVEKTLLSAKLLLLWAYFALTGLGYFVIEIGLMNFYQIFMGSPTHAFIFILGALLLASGMGSWFSRRFTPRGSLLTFCLILIGCAFHLFFGRHIMSILGAGPLHNSMIIALMVFPLGFCMGIPFPLGIETAKAGLGRDRAAIFFAVNTLFSAFAVIFGFYLSVAHGFQTTFATGIALYAVSFLIIAALFRLFHQKALP